jgi:hypothetical protein
MRHEWEVRLVVWSVAATAAIALFIVSSASAVTAPRTVPLHVTVNGSGTLRVPGNPAFTCRAHFPTSSHCRHTFYFRKGRRIVVKESPASGWKLWRWTGACHGSAERCSLRLKARRFGFVTASFVPPGDRLNPYPLGTPVQLVQGWKVKVNSAIINADAQVEAVNGNVPPPAGAQYSLVNLSMTYTNGGSGDLGFFAQGYLGTEGAGNAGYAADGQCETPAPDLGVVGQVFSGQTETGNLCFLIASNDAATLLLNGPAVVGNVQLPVWFALR